MYRKPVEHPVLDAIRENAAVIKDGEAESVANRNMSPTIAKLFREIGVMRIVQPARYGGFEADPRVFNEAMFEIAKLSTSAGWVTGVVGVHSWNLGLFDDRAQQEVWGDDPDVWISSSYGPAGRAKRVSGGYELTGRWSFSSGSGQSDWVFVGGLVMEDGAAPEYRHFLLKQPDYQIVDVWNPSGLTGTGSNDIVVNEMFVPDYHTLPVADTLATNVPGREVNPGPLFAVPWFSILLNSVVVPLLGMASTGIELAFDYHRQKFEANNSVVPGDMTLARLTEATALVDYARETLLANVGDIYDVLVAGGTPTLAQRMRSQRDHIMAVQFAIKAIDAAYQSGGPRSIHNANPLQQLWRDAHAGEHHAMNLPDSSMPNYARYLLTGNPGLAAF